MTSVHFSRRRNGWYKILSGCLVPGVGSPTVNDVFLLITKTHHHFVLMAQSTACWSSYFHGLSLQGTFDPKTRRALLPHRHQNSARNIRMLTCKQIHTEVTCFLHKHQTDLVIPKSKLLALQHATTYTAYSGSSPKKKNLVTEMY